MSGQSEKTFQDRGISNLKAPSPARTGSPTLPRCPPPPRSPNAATGPRNCATVETFQVRKMPNLKAPDPRDRAQELRTGSADGALAVLQSPTSSPGRPWFVNPRPSNSVGRPPGQKLENLSSSGQQRFSPYFIGVCGLFLESMIAKHLFVDHAFDRFCSVMLCCSRLHELCSPNGGRKWNQKPSTAHRRRPRC